MVVDAMRLNRTDGALVRVITPIASNEDVAAARKRAEEFTMRLAPLLRDLSRLSAFDSQRRAAGSFKYQGLKTA